MNLRVRVEPIHAVLLSFFMAVGLPAAFAAARPAPNLEKQGVVYFDHQNVSAGFAKGGYLYPRGSGNFSVMTARRDKAGQVELHTRDTDIIYVVDGSATFVTSGKIVQSKQIAPDEIRAPNMEGGTVRHISKGDVLVIPAGVPHWFKEVPAPVLYYVVKVR